MHETSYLQIFVIDFLSRNAGSEDCLFSCCFSQPSSRPVILFFQTSIHSVYVTGSCVSTVVPLDFVFERLGPGLKHVGRLNVIPSCPQFYDLFLS